ncbi:allantoate amidohydrolase [Hymenobacter busanensis]|uniref:Allantoate amidohydrolase n=1 Tax=Hymenobacter busanensis TaxID=2607656 RepID=A0A7L4ZV54_9BACT|nr:allantoate amidohydrolase [Hymenobacter busanensis]KAA9327580.1 allantoate amidohydrolase [Hymenobacter busanensis]QHJ06082.1 allantoate amidohydrolase [Hymenobacter busanensis]
MQEYHARAARLLQRIHELAAISEDADGVTRTFGTPAFLRGSALVRAWMEAAGLQTRIDSIGNVRGRLLNPRPGAKTFVIGSHIDTVVNAGRFDGPLGVLLGLDLLEHLGEKQAELPFHFELMAFSDEEGVRFHTTYLGSKVAAGSFDQALLPRTDAAGISLAEAIATMGGDAGQLAADALPADQWLGYFEAHIEQGPVLWERNIPVALVTAIAGQRRVGLTFTGMAGHAGTVPMDMRQDALAGCAEFVLAVEQFGLDHKAHLVATVGKLDMRHSASNVISGEATCSLDLRSADAARLAAAYDELHRQAEAIAQRRGLTVAWNPIQQTAPVACDAEMNKLLAQAIAEAGHPVVELVSGAGHDAVPISAVAPATMLFVRCYKGISHNPLENAEQPDIAAALEVSERFLLQLLTKEKLSS